jgi:hypothetical protein
VQGNASEEGGEDGAAVLRVMQCSSVLNESNLAGKTVVDVGGGYGDLIHAIESSMPTVGQCYCLGDWSYDCVRISTVHRTGRGAGKTLPTHSRQ